MTVSFFGHIEGVEALLQGFAEYFRPSQGNSPSAKKINFHCNNHDATRYSPHITTKVMRKCFEVKRSRTLQLWSRRTHSNLPNDGVVDSSAELEAAPTTSSELEEKLAALPSELLDEHVKQILKDSSESSKELFPTPGLPLSPLMDPRLIAARNRHRAPKPQPSGPPSALREKLQKNPYGTQCHLNAVMNPANHSPSTSSSDSNP